MCPHHPRGQAGLGLKSDCPRIPPFPGTGHSRVLQKPPGPCRGLQQGQVGCKEALELGRAQEIFREPANVQISGPLHCSNTAPRCCSRADGDQFGVWWTAPLGDTTSGHLVGFMQNVKLGRSSSGVLSHSMEGCGLEVNCSWFAAAEVRKQCRAAGGSWGGTQVLAHHGARCPVWVYELTPYCLVTLHPALDGCKSLCMASAEGLGEAGAVVALQRGASYLQNLQAVEARESFSWDHGDLVSREASAVKRRASNVSTSL